MSRFFCKENIKKFVCSTFVFVLFSCASVELHEINSYVGLYEITSVDCDIEKGSFDPCENTRFFEIVKGQFIGVKDTDLAYVFWSGDPKIDPELQYTSHLISNHKTKKITKDKFWLNNDPDAQEYLMFSGGVLQKYYVRYNSGDKGRERIIQYTLTPVRRGNLPLFRMNYPGKE